MCPISFLIRDLSPFYKCPLSPPINAPIQIWWGPLFRQQMPISYSHDWFFFSSLESASFWGFNNYSIFTSDNYSLYFNTWVSPFPLIIKRALNVKRPRAISPKARSLRSDESIDDIVMLLVKVINFQSSIMRICLEPQSGLGFLLFIRCKILHCDLTNITIFLARFVRLQIFFQTITTIYKAWCLNNILYGVLSETNIEIIPDNVITVWGVYTNV